MLKIGAYAAAAALAASPLGALALAVPMPAGPDAHVQIADYNRDEVYSVKTQFGIATLIQFQEDERMESASALGVGDAEAWNIGVRANNVLFKPIADAPETNLIVVTNKRTYVFRLSMKGGARQKTTYALRFNYGASKQTAAPQARRPASVGAKPKGMWLPGENYMYYGRGDKSLAPDAMYDDGRFTYLVYRSNADLPTIYKLSSDGTETLVNQRIEGDTVIIHDTAKDWVLRLGLAALGIENKAYKPGAYNAAKATGGAVRIVNGEDEE